MCADVTVDAEIQIAKAIFKAFVAKDREAAESLIAQNFCFTSPLDNALDRDAHFAICWPNGRIYEECRVLPHFQSWKWGVHNIESDISGGRRIRNTEVLTVNGNKISRR